MKKIILPALIAALVSVQSIAEYQVQYGERQISGDNIKFVTYGNWMAADPSISAWVNDGVLTGCSNWIPLETTVEVGVSFPQTATNCQQKQTRTVQNREQNDYSHEYKNVGDLITENQTLTGQSSQRTSIGTKIPQECSYVFGHSTTMSAWIDNTQNKDYQVWWKGTKIYEKASNTLVTEYTGGGFKYVRSTYMQRDKRSEDSWYQYYTICRSAVL